MTDRDARELRALVKQSQQILAAWLEPDGLRSAEALNKLLELLDNGEVIALMKRTAKDD